MRLNFWKTEVREVGAKPQSNLEIAIDLLTQIKHKAPSSRQDIIRIMVEQEFENHHIHRSPTRKTA